MLAKITPRVEFFRSLSLALQFAHFKCQGVGALAKVKTLIELPHIGQISSFIALKQN